MDESYDRIFEACKVQDVQGFGEYIVSNDSNYDIRFSDMPVVMAAVGARAWYGVMSRAKGLTSSTRIKSGKLDLMGTTFRVDWDQGRIDYRHPECTAFGYSHAVWEFMRYEQHNGYVWTTRDCHYVYGKGSETTDELLFFHVVRVPKLHNMVEPRFVDKPYAGYVEIDSIWAEGEELNGLPTSFSKVKYFVDALNFSKILEKRRCLDHKGDLAVTVGLVRSTSVSFWLSGAYVSANKKIEARLIDATAVAVEAMAAKGRLASNMLFSDAMAQFKVSVQGDGWLRRCLTSVVDLRAVSGAIAMPLMRVWHDVRDSIIDGLLGPLADFDVKCSVVESYQRLEDANCEVIDAVRKADVSDRCKCGEIAEVRAAMHGVDGDDKVVLERYLQSLNPNTVCVYCVGDPVKGVIPDVGIDLVSDIKPESGSDSGYESDSVVGSDRAAYVEPVAHTWSDEQYEHTSPAESMREFIALEHYLNDAQLTEIRVDSTRIKQRGPVTEQSLSEFATTRTKHAYLVVQGGRVIRSIGVGVGDVSAVYDHVADRLVAVREKRGVKYIDLPNGMYYTCSRLKVWNSAELIQSVEHALAYGVATNHRARFRVTIGVPGAGKTRTCVEKIAKEFFSGVDSFLYLGVTVASVNEAKSYGVQFGLTREIVEARMMTLDSYLMHKKFPAANLYCDEYPAVHLGKWDAAVSLAGSTKIELYGDANQVEYNPFCAEFVMHHEKLAGSVGVDQVTFMPKTHRLRRDVCAMWVDRYPSIFPCDCCDVEGKNVGSLSYERVVDLSSKGYDPNVRYHTYRQDEKDELKVLYGLREDSLELRARKNSGMATVHEDQGSTHKNVVTVRLHADYDKNASRANPSLYNRLNYVLSDTTRHVESYTYLTCSDEDDEICKRIRMSTDVERLALVDAHAGFGNVNVLDLL